VKRVPASLALLLLHQEADRTGDERYRIAPSTLRCWVHRGKVSKTAAGYDLREVAAYASSRASDLSVSA
jgi:hypothetical protein